MTKKTEIVLIRHGQTEWNVEHRMQGHLNSDLTAEGQSQIEALGNWMQKFPFDHIYSSDTLRAKQTAEAITCFSGHTLEFDQRLREKNLGVFEGLTSEEAQSRFPEYYRLFKTAGAEYVIETGESTQQLLDRALDFVEEIRLKHPQKRILLVTHGGLVRVLMKNTLGISLDQPTHFKIQNTGLYRMSWEDNWVVTQMGQLCHLD